MSHLLEVKNGKYRFWSSICDGWVTDWLTRDDALAWIRRIKELSLEREMDEETKNFPNGWCNKEGRIYCRGVNDE
jgi:hypothetical protein